MTKSEAKSAIVEFQAVRGGLSASSTSEPFKFVADKVVPFWEPGRLPTRLAAPKDILRNFLNVGWHDHTDLFAYVRLYGVPVKHEGWGPIQEGEAVPPELELFAAVAEVVSKRQESKVRGLRQQLLDHLGYYEDYFTVQELRALQAQYRELLERIPSDLTVLRRGDAVVDELGALWPASRLAAEVSELARRVTLKLEASEMRRSERYDHRLVAGLRLLASPTRDFESILAAGALQVILEERPLRRCKYGPCQEWFQPSQRRDQEFCGPNHNVAFQNGRRNRPLR